jgi:hypothetical protein
MATQNAKRLPHLRYLDYAGRFRPHGEQSALVLMQLFNMRLPKRLQLDDIAVLMRLGRFQALSKRELAKQLLRAWRQCGCIDAKRGVHLPQLAHFQARLATDVHELNQLRVQKAVR